jgi:hypothetical protein
VVFITGLIFMLDSKKVQRIILSAFVAIAVMTHYSISTYVAQEENTIRDFWWQVSWRVPALNKGTTLMVNYPSITYGEDIDIVTGPALFIYFPNRTAQIPVEYEVSGFQIGNDSLTKILSQEKAVDSGYRSHVYTVDYQNILVMTQPTENACVHILDNQYSELSTQDTDQVLLVGNYSNIQNVQSDGNSPRPPALLFGSEPAHTWCYYYEKAELARQKADWSIVADLGKKAVQQGLHPNDAVEWMPFIEADAILGNAQNLKDIAPRMTWDHFLKAQACTTLTELQNKGIKFSSDVQNVIKDAFCQK